MGGQDGIKTGIKSAKWTNSCTCEDLKTNMSFCVLGPERGFPKRVNSIVKRALNCTRTIARTEKRWVIIDQFG